jgi:hypothetical protein
LGLAALLRAFHSLLTHRVGRRRGCQPDLDGVKMIESLAPDRFLLRRVTSMALVRDYQIEGVDGNVQLVGELVPVSRHLFHDSQT